MFFFEAKRFIIVILGALLNAMALNFFLIQANVYASGFTGIANYQRVSRKILWVSILVQGFYWRC